jgi:hypothetical protein
MKNVIASSFADPKDIAAFKKWYKVYRDHGMSEEEATKAAFAKGDNGVGFTGIFCATEKECLCALPPEEWKAKWGSKAKAGGKGVIVTYNGKEVSGRLGDTMPPKGKRLNDALIDLNPGFAKAFGETPPFMLKGVSWRWA